MCRTQDGSMWASTPTVLLWDSHAGGKTKNNKYRRYKKWHVIL